MCVRRFILPPSLVAIDWLASKCTGFLCSSSNWRQMPTILLSSGVWFSQCFSPFFCDENYISGFKLMILVCQKVNKKENYDSMRVELLVGSWVFKG